MSFRARLTLLLLAGIVCPALAETTSSEVYHRAQLVAAEINLIRLEMGVAANQAPDIAVSGAQPREVYFQALTLFEKSNRLLFEQLRERADKPTIVEAASEITPDDVLHIVEVSLQLVLRVKASLEIAETATVAPRNEPPTPTDVYKLIVNLNRSLNNLLQQRFSPADVYQQITYGVSLAATILATIDSSGRLGSEAAYVRRKTPRDVYHKLIDLYMIVHETIRLSGRRCLVIEPFELTREAVSPSDVYDLASLLVSELSFLHSLTPGVERAKDSYYPGDRLPAHAYQRATRLESQVTALRDYAAAHPDWLVRR